ncbi:MAG: hypothetical protein OKBPIBMD_02136 [Chlorobi bacterium]|nr:MAG: BNR/Asp-box repeat protein [Chlorobi bacterium OLB6]MBV6464643.1 hypothetical protein [Chlorobiota bacterium]
MKSQGTFCLVVCILLMTVVVINTPAQMLERITGYSFTGDWYQTTPISDNEYIIAAGYARLIRWNVDDRTFTKLPEIPCMALTSFAAYGDSWYLGTWNGTLLISTNQGVSWEELYTFDTGMMGVWVFHATGQKVYGLVGDAVFIYDTQTKKVSVVLQDQPGRYTCLDVHGQVLTVAGMTGKVVQSHDDGATWEVLQSDSANRISAICRVDDTTIVFGGSATRMWTSYDNGRSMTYHTVLSSMYYNENDIPNIEHSKILSIVYTGGRLMAVGQMAKLMDLPHRYGLYVSTSQGQNWEMKTLLETPQELPVRFQIANAILPRSDGSVYVVEPAFDEDGTVRITRISINYKANTDTLFFNLNVMDPNPVPNSKNLPYIGRYLLTTDGTLYRLVIVITVLDDKSDNYSKNEYLNIIQKSTDRGVTWITTGELTTDLRINSWYIGDGNIYVYLASGGESPPYLAVSTDGGLTFTISKPVTSLLSKIVGDVHGRQTIGYSGYSNDTVGSVIQSGLLFDVQKDGTCTRIELPKLAEKLSVSEPVIYKDSLYLAVCEFDEDGRVAHAWILSSSLPVSDWKVHLIPFGFDNLQPFVRVSLWTVTDRHIYLKSGQLHVADFDAESGTVTEQNVMPEVDLTDPWNQAVQLSNFVAFDDYLFFTIGQTIKVRSRYETQWHSISRCYGPESGFYINIFQLDSVTWFVARPDALYHLHLDAPATSVSEYPQQESDVRSIVIQRDQPLQLDNATITAVLYTNTGEAVATIPVVNGVPYEVPVSQFAPGVYYLVEKTPQQPRLTKVMVTP